MDFHPIADLFPLMQGAAFDALVADIRANGLREPITVHGEKIIDGRNRFRACKAANIEARFRSWDESGSLTSFVWSMNGPRRHMDESQRAMVAAKMATLEPGRPQENTSIDVITQQQAADLVNVGIASVQRGREILDHGTAELIDAAEQGEIPVGIGCKLAHWEPEDQASVVEHVKKGLKPTEAMRAVIKERAAAKEVSIPSERYRIVYADPPWSYGNTQPDYHTEQRDHYGAMTLEEICQLPVEGCVEDDAVLFIWVTSPILEDSFKVIKRWGFEYKASFVWDKVKHNMGHYNSVRHEFLLICTRGACTPDVRKLFDSVITEERTEHSKKPKKIYDIIETLYTHGKRLELFARGKARKGWKVFGNESY